MSTLLRFEPIYQERVWGGRRLAEMYGRDLPTGSVIGESWELVDRPEAQSSIRSGPRRGTTLHDLWTGERLAIFGTDGPQQERFPILIKLLDASDKLSLQVHPPSAAAPALGGEPKTEMWFITRAEPGAELFCGLRRGVTRESFVKALEQGGIADCFHRIATRAGDCMFMPSGRIHAIGAGHVICEIQQNSDTTFRVYDWDRKGLDGRPRALHIEESLRSIDFSDIEPTLEERGKNPLVKCPYFSTFHDCIAQPQHWEHNGSTFTLFFVVEGSIKVAGELLNKGEFGLVPAGAGRFDLDPIGGSVELLWIQW